MIDQFSGQKSLCLRPLMGEAAERRQGNLAVGPAKTRPAALVEKAREWRARAISATRCLNLIRSGSSEFANRSAASDSGVIVDRNGGAPRAAISPQHIKLERVLLATHRKFAERRLVTPRGAARGGRSRPPRRGRDGFCRGRLLVCDGRCIVSPIKAISFLREATSPTATRPQCRPARKSAATPNSRTSAKVAAPLDGFATKLQFVTMG
jgi:hypothetical protein